MRGYRPSRSAVDFAIEHYVSIVRAEGYNEGLFLAEQILMYLTVDTGSGKPQHKCSPENLKTIQKLIDESKKKFAQAFGVERENYALAPLDVLDKLTKPETKKRKR